MPPVLRHSLIGITVRGMSVELPPEGVANTEEVLDLILLAFPGIRDDEEVKLHYTGMGSRPSVWTFGRIFQERRLRVEREEKERLERYKRIFGETWNDEQDLRWDEI